MKTRIISTILLVAALALSLQITAFATGDNTLYLQIGDRTLTATLVDNSATRALKELLAGNPLTINMSDYGGFEKVGSLGTSLPTSNQSITTEAGDLILYQGNQLVIFYEPNSWSYTRLGKINDVTQTELKSILGTGNVTVTLSVNNFGEVPKTGFPNLTRDVAVIAVLFAVAAGLWVYILRRKQRKANHG
jgi:hypothetical protein